MGLEGIVVRKSGHMKATSPTIKSQEKARCDTKMVRLTLATSKMAKNTDLEFTTGLMALPLRDGILKIKNKVMVSLEPAIIKFLKESGVTVNVREREC
jgi:hypothetical protein